VDGAEQFYDTPALSRVRDYTADGALRSLEDSLRRLRLDRADIALIHDPDDHLAEALDGAYSALARLRADGTIGAIGVGVNSTSVAEWFVARCDLDCVLVAGRYTLLDDSAAASLFPLCLANGVAVLAAGVFNGGILADPADGARYDYAPAAPAVLARARRIAEVCARYEIPVAAAAVRYVLRHPAVTAAVVGARTPQEIRGDAGYLGQAVPEALWAELAGLR
jgi:D-threo-aldose 1-dehydrogenase